MGKVFEQIDDKIRHWIGRQKMFFVASAPLAADGHVNLSPKGLDTLRVLGPTTLAYLDFGGSGIETIAHVRENERLTIMMCAFDGPPKIFRFYGQATVCTPDQARFAALVANFDVSEVGVRAIIVLEITRIGDSCGFGVPLYEYREQRPNSPNWLRRKGTDSVRTYLAQNNARSLDGLPGIAEEEAAAFQAPTQK